MKIQPGNYRTRCGAQVTITASKLKKYPWLDSNGRYYNSKPHKFDITKTI